MSPRMHLGSYAPGNNPAAVIKGVAKEHGPIAVFLFSRKLSAYEAEQADAAIKRYPNNFVGVYTKAAEDLDIAADLGAMEL